MAAPRSTSLRALRLLASQQHAPVFRRSLHITGAFSAQPARGPDVTAIYRSRNLGDLRAECERRNLRHGGSKAELVDRLANHDVLQSRAFSIAMRKIDSSRPVETGSSTRPLNTSRAQKSVNDNSTIDFVYMPRDIYASPSSAIFDTPIPILPDAYSHYQLANDSTTYNNNNNNNNPMKPQIYTVAGDYASSPSSSGGGGGGASAMSEVVDNHAVEFDPFELTETVRRARERAAVVEERAAMGDGTVKGVAKQFWEGVVEDLLGKGSGVEGRR